MNCPACGRFTEDGAKFCVGCGSPVSGQPPQPWAPGQLRAKKLSVAAVVWCWVCIVMFFGLGFLNLGE
jgi:uncharacterized membrane protein YvbJ